MKGKQRGEEKLIRIRVGKGGIIKRKKAKDRGKILCAQREIRVSGATRPNIE
jgi:hypothetical protein